MNENNQSGMINSEAVQNQLEQLEEQNATKEQNKKGSTNEVQPMAAEERLTQ